MATNSVSVLLPNGRRQTVKCTPNTTILQIIEEACKKHAFNPEEHDIKHHNKILDTSCAFRFSGLPNNAQLELVAASKIRVESEVLLAINLDNGDRLMGNFQPSETLYDILIKLCPNDTSPDKNPVVIYTRREIFYKDFKNITLKSLGITSGRAMLRLVHRSPEELQTQANISGCLPSKPAEEKPYRRILKQSDPDIGNNAKSDLEPQNVESSSNEGPKPWPQQPKKETDLLKLAREKRKLNESSTNQTKIKPKIESTNIEEPMEVDAMETNSDIEKFDESQFVFLGNRNAMLFSLESAQDIPTEDLPDDFFELTIDDAKKILRDIKRKQQEMENNPLLTSALRNMEETNKQLRQLNKYKKSVIRVQFPNRAVLQGTFSPTETVGDVISFVREYLQDKNLNFHLFTTPPKSVLSEKSRLIEIGCVPGALLHLGTDSVDRNENYLREDLKDKFTTNFIASLAACKMRKESVRAGHMADSKDCDEPVAIAHFINEPRPSTSTALSDEYSYTSPRQIKSTEKVPKWFKPR